MAVLQEHREYKILWLEQVFDLHSLMIAFCMSNVTVLKDKRYFCYIQVTGSELGQIQKKGLCVKVSQDKVHTKMKILAMFG